MKHLYKEGKRKCYHCKKILELNEHNFGKDSRSALGFRYECKPCKKEFSNNGGVRRKIIEEVNFSCVKCGLQKKDNYQFFDIDHIKPIRRRGNQLRQGYYYKDKDRGNLQVLCPNCHRLKTVQEGYR